ncbi:MAG: response regulator [Edaphobacter sp.]|uniref:response regulator n=1 Tax=Edaphobacter sp. TaxID=1934404 RepID=UPI00239F2E30|nr:response regulator [Edaphobacter sp.]MDE1177074.1 response regulator [Edaphobacter sp.]
MTSEQNMPEVQSHQGSTAVPIPDGDSQYAGGSSAPGMGQSKSSRRRRRKRKNKGLPSEAGAPQAESSPQGQLPLAEGAAPAQAAPQQSSGQPFQGGQQQQGNGNGAKRWKKKFRDGGRGDRPRSQSGGDFNASGQYQQTHQPGNSTFKRSKGGGGGGKQQRGPRSFVGPMDHSYREVNGNFADTPPSTIDTGNHRRSNGHGRNFHVSDSQPIDYSQGRTIPIPEDAPTKILFFIEDLFFTAKIQETSRKLGVKVAFVKNDKDVIAQLTTGEEERPALIVFDLNNTAAKPLTLIPKLKSKLKRGTSIIGFLSHLQGDLKAKAVEAGCD